MIGSIPVPWTRPGDIGVVRVLADCYRRAQIMRVIAMFDPPVWVRYPAILLYDAPANRRRTDERRPGQLTSQVCTGSLPCM